MPAGLQEWIHQIEEGQGVRYIKLALILLGLTALAIVYNLREFSNFTAPDAMETAQLARNIAEGRGYTTWCIRPLSIALLQNARGDSSTVFNQEQPDLATPPVYPFFLAAFMKVLPFHFNIPPTFSRYQPEVLIAVINQLLFFASMLVIFRLARRLFDGAVAWLAVIIMATTDLFWRFSISGLSTMLLMLLLAALVLCLVHLEEKSRATEPENQWSHPRFILLAGAIGLLLALGALTRYSFAWLCLPVIGFIAAYTGSRRTTLCLVTLGVFLLLFSPWIYRNYATSGTFFGIPGLSIHQETGPGAAFPGNRLERSMPRNLDALLSSVAISEYVRKLVVNLESSVQEDLPRFGGSWLSAFFLVGLLIPFRNPSINRLRLWLVGSLLLMVIVQSMGRTHLSTDTPRVNSENLLVIFAPLAFMFGTALFFMLLDQLLPPLAPFRRVAIATFVLLLSAPLLLRFMPPRSSPIAWPPYYPPMIDQIAGWMEPGELIMSDVPWAVAWYGGRQSLWVTLDSGREARSDFFAINDYQKSIKGLYLTQLTMDSHFVSETIKGSESAWSKFAVESLFRTNVPTGFPLRQAPAGLLPDQLFLSDRIRWKKSAK